MLVPILILQLLVVYDIICTGETNVIVSVDIPYIAIVQTFDERKYPGIETNKILMKL